MAHKSEHDDLLAALAEETAKLGPIGMMQIAPEQGAFMAILARAIGAKRAVEVGTFTGYSALSVARALPDDGKLLACDVNEEWTQIARRYWDLAQVGHKIELRIGPALDTLRALPKSPQFDLGFIDADKPNYLAYYEEVLLRLRPNGLLLFDNTLWSGAVADPAIDDDQTLALRALNDRLVQDARVEVVVLPIADGLSIVRKKDMTELG